MLLIVTMKDKFSLDLGTHSFQLMSIVTTQKKNELVKTNESVIINTYKGPSNKW